MHMDQKTPMTPEAKDALKQSIMSAVEACLNDEQYTSADQVIDKVVEDLEAMKGGPEMGGMGEEAARGMKMPEGEGEEE